MLRSFLYSTLLFSILILTGCGESGPEIHRASGQVVFSDGTPVRSGIIELSSLDHALTATGRIQPDGSFVLGTHSESDGACAGQHQAIVMQMIISDGMVRHTQDHGQPVDPRFYAYETSGLQFEIVAMDENHLRVVVERKDNQSQR